MDPCTHGGARVHGMYVVVYLGIRKVGKALNRGHALMHMLTTWKHITIAHTKASIEGKPPKKHKHRHNMMEANNEQTDHNTQGYMQYNTRQKERE